MTTATGDARGLLREQVADEVRVWMTRRRMSGVKLAEMIGKSQPYVSRRLNGVKAFDIDDLELIGRVLNVPVSKLLPISPRFDGPTGPGTAQGGATVSYALMRRNSYRSRTLLPVGRPRDLPRVS